MHLNLVDFNLSLVKVAKKKKSDHILFLSFPDKQYLEITVFLIAVGPMSQGIIACKILEQSMEKGTHTQPQYYRVYVC